MSGSTPVGFLYTPQQLAGSVRYGSGVLLGNWREDDALGEMRMMDHIEAKETASLTLLKKTAKLQPQLEPVALSPAPSDGAVKIGDTVLLQSQFHFGVLSVSLGQSSKAADDIDPDKMYMAVGSNPQAPPSARSAIKFVSYEGAAAGSPLLYGQKVCLEFSSPSLGCTGYLASARSGRMQLATQIINKQEAFVQETRTATPPYDCAWFILPENMDDRIISNGSPVQAGAPFVLVHCFTNARLAGVNIEIKTDFGSELGVCVHTFYAMNKVNKMMRECSGRPTNNLISRSETSENLWAAIYGA